jgi:hypothetical protein
VAGSYWVPLLVSGKQPAFEGADPAGPDVDDDLLWSRLRIWLRSNFDFSDSGEYDDLHDASR